MRPKKHDRYTNTFVGIPVSAAPATHTNEVTAWSGDLPFAKTTAAPELDADMTPGDIVHELRQLKFDRGNNEFKRIKIDGDVRDYLVNTLSARAVRRA
jgi:hypothetical protein